MRKFGAAPTGAGSIANRRVIPDLSSANLNDWAAASVIGIDGFGGANLGSVGLWIWNGSFWDRAKAATFRDGNSDTGFLGSQGIGTAETVSPGITGISMVLRSLIGIRTVGVANTQIQNVYDLRQLAQVLDILSAASGGTSTLTVEGSVDNVNFVTIDSIAAALTNVKHYNNNTVGASTALTPLSFRFLRVTAGAAGVGNTVTLTVTAK